MSNQYFQQAFPVNIGMGINIFKTTISKGVYNIGIGANVFVNNISAVNNYSINNIGIGGNIFVSNTSGINNIAVGGNIFGSNTTGSYNTAIGGNIFTSNVTGSYNTGLGTYSGNSILGSYNTMVGANTGQATNDSNVYNNSTAIGYGATVNASNQIVLGTAKENVTVSGNLYVGGFANSLQFVESIYPLTASASITANFMNSMVFSIPSATATITSLTLTNVPTTANKSYTFTFIMGTTNSAAYISAGTISVNGSPVNLQGAIISTVPSYYIVQQIILFNLGGTFNVALTTASFF